MSRPTRDYQFAAQHQSLELPEPPCVSRLYSLLPIGVGTGFVESLTSYSARLARAHRVSPAQLFTKEILPLMNQVPHESRIGRINSGFGGYNRFFNGCAKPADFLTSRLERLTLRSDLVWLSMLRWRGTIASVSLSKQLRAWCARCLNEWRQQGKAIFEPLVWTINLVSLCTVHHSPLTIECPACNKRSAPLEGRLRAGYCAKCDAWLGQVRNCSRASSRFATSGAGDLPPEFISSQIFAALEMTDKPVDGLTLTTRISTMLQSRGFSNAAFLRAAGMQKGAFFSPRYASRGVSLKVLLRICYSGEMNLKDLLNRQAAGPSADQVIIRRRIPQVAKWKNKLYIDALRSALETALAEPCPTGVITVAARSQCSPEQLREKFPQLCQSIALKRNRVRVRRRQRLARMLKKALDAKHPQPIHALAKRIGGSYGWLYKTFPLEVSQLSARYQAFKKQSVVIRKAAAADRTRAIAYKLHEQGEYPSVRKVFKELGWKRTRERDEYVREVLTDVRNQLGLTKRDFTRALLQ